MKNLGILLAVLGAIALAYGGAIYNSDRTIVKMGSMEVTASDRRSVPTPAVVGLVMLVGGFALIFTQKPRSS